ncbi:agmatine deiminase [Levilactobacillus namurensis DSM 19117]|uniref:Putative agmatine deiminase n=2 Tax=Levilactobacillus namurensis TaxID=380393 RepID=A0A0R1K148_9LACO|nr:agmatine deiminase [Levilactobacillus namurensis]PTM21730.1 agmatine deiminase [Lactobacillus sp. PFC-70]KRK76827.1 agmatine deiminase [Levilactobacillus namurensis DSM 19117]MCW3778472.1 agmatine deiminase [Levilactobacillus namurensis]MDT7013449.1 agmatine deiminase [Levilactobacillus namurensis]MDT7019741.1 agmatine deiminase [Levilactobacillus namurensis]
MKTLDSTPKQDGYRMPGEFEPHKGVYILWPQRPDNWRNGGKPAQKTFVEVAKAISEFEHVTVGVNDDQYANARTMLPDNVEVVEMSNDDSWIRDCGATFVVNDKGGMRGVDWTFNSWGGLVDGLYFPWDKDDRVAQKMTEMEHVDRYRLDDFVLEGGSIHVDGEGTLIATEECLLSKGRNPQLSKAQIEEVLKEHLNLEKIIWLKKGIYLDETNGHVDNIANFVKPGEIALAWTDDQNDPQYAISKENLEILENATDAKGRKIKVDKLYLPKPITITKEESEGVDAVDGTLPRTEGERLAASYVNYYTANGGIVFPLFNDPADEKAKETLQALYPDRKVVGVPAREVLLGGGNIHCITQQVPQA